MPGGWEGSDRREELPPDWVAIVVRIKRRDGHRCRFRLPSGKRCPRTDVQVDHIIPGNDHSDTNLRCLCTHHHSKKSSREGNNARWRKKKIRRRTEGKHPGTIG